MFLEMIIATRIMKLAMSAIGTDLQLSPYHRAGLLIFEETDPGYGFPATLPPMQAACRNIAPTSALPFSAALR